MGTVKYTGPVASFHCPTNAEIRSLKVHFSPKQEGSGDPSPENVREIVGWDGVEVYRNGSTTNYEFGVLGKNKFDYANANIVDKKRRDDNGNVVSDSSGSYCQTLIPVRPNVTYTISGYPVNNNSKRIYYIDANEGFIERTAAFGDSSYTFTTPDSCYYIQIQNREVGDNASWETVQLELGPTATAYEPYNPKHTVYGGWVDLVSGKVCEEWGKYTFTGNEPDNVFRAYNSTYNGYGVYTAQLSPGIGLINSSNPSTQIKSDIFCSATNRGYAAEPDKTYVIRTWSGKTPGANINAPFLCGEFGGTTIADFKAWLSQYKPTIMYNLETPNTYYLAPTQLQTFLGQNNVWSNADYVEVEYDLHETQDILNRKNFIIANQPHTVKPAAAPLQNFTTDVSAPLKECKVHFAPVQNGTGDPSPDNVRVITGWTGLTTYYSGENLYIPNINNKGYINASGAIKVDTTSTYTDLIPVTAGEIYSFKCTTARVDQQSTNRRLHGYDSDGNWIRQIAFKTTDAATVEDVSLVETIPSDISYIRVSFRNQDTNVRVAKENVVSVNWSTEAGTIYGGYVDLVNGEVVQEWETIKIADLNWYNYSAKIHYYTNLPSRERNTYIYTDTLTPRTTGSFTQETIGELTYYGEGTTATYKYIWTKLPEAMEATEANEWIKSTYANAIICYKLETPVHYSLSPTQLKSLRGTNNIWASNNGGNIEVSFWRH